VLVVEDVAQVRAVACEMLTRHGYTVLEAADAETALRLAGKHEGEIHLLLTDVVMPDSSGRELADELVSLRPRTKVLYMSGYTDDAVVRHGVLQEGIPFLQKPFTPESLARKLRAVLDQS
jgi:CheY-like chemotaxis protein